MNIVCDQCQSKFNIPDDKIPSGKTVTFKCLKCQNKIVVSVPEGDASSSAVVGLESDGYEAEDKPFGYLEEGAKTALVCESDASVRQSITQVLERMGYHLTVAVDTRTALKKMRYHVYDLVVVNEMFNTKASDTNGVLIYLERLTMSVRRDIYVLLLSRRHRTMDQMKAFHKSVNLIVNLENILDFDKILQRGLKEHEGFYSVFRDTMKKIGRV